MDISIAARPALPSDLDSLMDLYGRLSAEMTSIHPMWPRADGLAEPVADSFLDCLEDPRGGVYLGTVDDYPLGFILGESRSLPPGKTVDRIAAVRMVFVEEQARGVGVGTAMLNAWVEDFRSRGHHLFDAHVLPGHRLAKNFFEAGGFSARSIVMHHNDRGGGGRRIRAMLRP